MRRLFSITRQWVGRVDGRECQSPELCVCSCVSLLLGIVAIFTGCAHISFHDPANPSGDVGVEYYKPKFYLLITKNKDGTKADTLTLPNLTRPRYALLHLGYGSSNLSLKLSNGVLTDVGQTVDTKIPETITALSGLATAAAMRAAPSETMSTNCRSVFDVQTQNA
jgi:hypothetical protein